MILQGEKEKCSLVESILSHISSEVLNRYWNGFETVPFAVYDIHNIYLANHPSPPEDFRKFDNISIGRWRQEFYANTMINFEGEAMGIVSLDTLSPASSFEKIYSLVIHEMFHAYQIKAGFFERVKYNEMTFMQYPFTSENVGLRAREREELLKAAFAKDKAIQEEHLARFISFREKRKSIIGDVINYELGLESIEGTATYVEYMANLDTGHLPKDFVLSKYGINLSGYPEDFSSFRQSCYSSGMFMCLVLDSFNENWQREYIQSGKFLYEFFREVIDITEQELEFKSCSIARHLASEEIRKRLSIVDNFTSSTGFKVILIGNMTIAGFNPMQVVPVDGQVLHQTILKVKTKSQSLFLNMQSLAKHGLNPWEIEEIIIFVKEKPVIGDGIIKIQGIGELNAKVELADKTFYVKLS